jgi:hypothetical protein
MVFIWSCSLHSAQSSRFCRLLEGLGEGDDGWLHNCSKVAVAIVVPPDAVILPAVVRFELAEWCEVVDVYDDRNLDRLLAGIRSVRNSHNVAELGSEGFDRGLGDVLAIGRAEFEGPRVSLPFRDSEVKSTNDVENLKSRFYSTQKIQEIKLARAN